MTDDKADRTWKVDPLVPAKLRELFREEFPEYKTKKPEKGHVTDWLCSKFDCVEVYTENPIDGKRFVGFRFKSSEALTAFLLEYVA